MSTLTEFREPLRAWLQDSATREAALLSTGYQGPVYLFSHNNTQWVLKRAGTGALTGWLHRLMLRREAAAYAKLDAVDGVPNSLGMLDAQWLVLEFIDGESLLEGWQPHEIDPARLARDLEIDESEIRSSR